MKGKKFAFLVVAFLLPITIFIFLKFFGKNEFDVVPLYQDELPDIQAGCVPPKLPYRLPQTIIDSLHFANDSLVLVIWGEPDKVGTTQLLRVEQDFKGERVHTQKMASSLPYFTAWKHCIFFVKEPYDLVLVDRRGMIRGQYVTNDREEVDRLLTELTILLKKY